MTAQIKPDISTWVDKAEQDLRVLRVLLRHAHDCWDAIGFHSQQAAEK